MAELDTAQKQEIRRYMVKVITIPSIGLAVMAFFIGFYLEKGATLDAYHAAYQDAMGRVLSLTISSTEAIADAKASRRETEILLREARSLEKEAEQLRNQLLTHQEFQSTENLVQNVAENLASREDFGERVAKDVDTRIMTEVARQLEDVRSSVNDLAVRTQNISSPDDCTTTISLGESRRAVFQCDGNLVVYRVGGDGKALWDSRTWVRGG